VPGRSFAFCPALFVLTAIISYLFQYFSKNKLLVQICRYCAKILKMSLNNLSKK
jgi:hypothetical protein